MFKKEERTRLTRHRLNSARSFAKHGDVTYPIIVGLKNHEITATTSPQLPPPPSLSSSGTQKPFVTLRTSYSKGSR